MYLSIDVGGTKTLVASMDDEGNVHESHKFPTPKAYAEFLKEVTTVIDQLEAVDFAAVGIAVPGLVDRERGIGVAFGNLPWKNVPIQADLEHIVHAPVVLDNDANCAALSEGLLLKKDYNVVLYVTIGTGIGTGIIVDGEIDPAFEDTEGGLMLLEHDDKLMRWQDFAAGSAIFRRYGKRASDIDDAKTWKTISRDFAQGMLQLIATIQPEVIVIGGGIGTHFPKYEKYLLAELKKYETPLTPTPPIRQAQRPEEAVVYGCYVIAERKYGYVR
jgi:predicted NBD/HSP70 family sugar kinase